VLVAAHSLLVAAHTSMTPPSGYLLAAAIARPADRFRRLLSARSDEGKFAGDLQSDQLHRLHSEMHQHGALGEAAAAAAAARQDFAGGRSTAVDLSPSIAAAMAWAKVRSAPPPSQAQVYSQMVKARERTLRDEAVERLAGGSGGGAGQVGPATGFDIEADPSGAIRVVPKKREATLSSSTKKDPNKAAMLAILAERPDMTERDLRQLFPRLFRGKSCRAELGWTDNTYHETPYWWWPGSWMTYGKMLSKVHDNRFVLFQSGRVDNAELAGHPMLPASSTSVAPNPEWEAKMEAERVRAVGQLLEQRAALRAQVRDIESDLRKLGMDVEEGVGGQSVLDMRKAEGRELATKALAIATVLVLFAASVGAYVFHLYTGVSTVREFRDWWRAVIRGQDYHSAAAPIAATLDALTPKIEGSELSHLAHNVRWPNRVSAHHACIACFPCNILCLHVEASDARY